MQWSYRGIAFCARPEQARTASLPGLPPRKKTVFRTLVFIVNRKTPPTAVGGVLTLSASANKITHVIQNYSQLALGIWILLSPWLLGFSSISIMTWSNLIAGIIIILINVRTIFGETISEEKTQEQ